MTNPEKVDILEKYLNEILTVSVNTLNFKDLYKFDKDVLQNLNKFHDENQKLIGTIQTILASKNIDKYCSDKINWVPPVYQGFTDETFRRVRSFSDHPKPFADRVLNTLNIDEVSEPPTAEAIENVNKYDSIFNEHFIPKFPDLNPPETPDIKIEVLPKPKKFHENFTNVSVKSNTSNLVKKATSYTSLIPIKSNMFLQHLDQNFKDFIKNPEDFKTIKFYYYKKPNDFDEENLFEYKKATCHYYIADNGKLYMLDQESQLIPGQYDNKAQLWKEKLI